MLSGEVIETDTLGVFQRHCDTHKQAGNRDMEHVPTDGINYFGIKASADVAIEESVPVLCCTILHSICHGLIVFYIVGR